MQCLAQVMDERRPKAGRRSVSLTVIHLDVFRITNV